MYNYSSCVPPIDTCLDGVCDEFEKLDPSLCPQDCYNNEKGNMQYMCFSERVEVGKKPSKGRQLTGIGRAFLNWIDFFSWQ